MNLSRRRTSRTLRPNLTPMIDVVLQLIIFFMYTSQFATLSRTAVDLPQQPGELVDEQQPETDLVIDMSPDGSLSVAGEPVDLVRLGRIVTVEAERIGGPESLRVLVRADRSALSLHLNTLAVELRSLGVERWRLGTAEVGSGGAE